MRLVIDLQGAQTNHGACFTGSLKFAKAVARNRKDHELFLVLSGLFPETIQLVRQELDGILPQSHILVWTTVGPTAAVDHANKTRSEVATLVRASFLTSLRPDVIHVTGLCNGYFDDAVTDSFNCTQEVQVSTNLDDLFQVLKADPDPLHRSYCAQKLSQYSNIKYFLPNWQIGYENFLSAINVDPESVVITGEGSFSTTQIDPSDSVRTADFQSTLKTGWSFALCVDRYQIGESHPDPCIRTKSVIQAWSNLHPHARENKSLLIAADFSEHQNKEVLRFASELGLSEKELATRNIVDTASLATLLKACAFCILSGPARSIEQIAPLAITYEKALLLANNGAAIQSAWPEAATFDPINPPSIAAAIQRALKSDSFLHDLRKHASLEAEHIYWSEAARGAIREWEKSSQKTFKSPTSLPCQNAARKPSLAFVSPLPPERTGIADYSAELLPTLSSYYDIELITPQPQVADPIGRQYKGRLRDLKWFRANAANIDRVVYQVGNSHFHSHMRELLQEIPGTVVLHDFFLSGSLMSHNDSKDPQDPWVAELYASHGYNAVKTRYADPESCQQNYPVNWSYLQHAHGVITHSEYSKNLAKQWYGDEAPSDWEVIPLVRSSDQLMDRTASRAALEIDALDFVVCSFGFIQANKLSHRLVDAWISSKLAQDRRCHLIFVGENSSGEYGTTLVRKIARRGLGHRVKITGFTSSTIYEQYLAAADLAVQLRTNSRGETSAAVLDCMNNALPVIINSNGSMDELSDDIARKIPDEFSDHELIEALETLWNDPEQRKTLGRRSQEHLHTLHSPSECAKRYASAIELFHQRNSPSMGSLIKSIAGKLNSSPGSIDLATLSSGIARSLPLPRPSKRLFLDITATCSHDLRTGIERVARAIVLALLESPPAGYRIEPVYISNEDDTWHHRYARNYTLGLLGCPSGMLADEPIDPMNGDVLLGLDISGEKMIQAAQAGLFSGYRDLGVYVQWVVYDLLPVRMPEVFPPGADRSHERWLREVLCFDRAICISKAVADDLAEWQEQVVIPEENRRHCDIAWWHLGADILDSAPSVGAPWNAEDVLSQIRMRPSFLMVGTIEPRKGHLQSIEAFSQLWHEQCDVNLVIVGREGWNGLEDSRRRNIPETIKRLRTHPELNKRLIWLEGISDEFLTDVYKNSSCLIAASYGEGFGLPLIEAAQHNLPIIARDIPVFREVAGSHAHYFDGLSANDLGNAVKAWLRNYQSDAHPKSSSLQWLSWKASAKQLLEAMDI